VKRGARRKHRVTRQPAPFRRHAAAFAAALVLGIATALWAHGALRRSDPGAGQRVAAPSRLRLEFNERVEPLGVVVSITDARGSAARLGAPALSGAAGDSSRVVEVPVLESLAPGRWRVAWQIVGRDGHPVRGRYAFEVVPGQVDAAGGPPRAQSVADSSREHHHDSAVAITDAPPSGNAAQAGTVALEAFDTESRPYVALRWLAYVMLLAGTGAIVMHRITDRAATVDARHAVQSRLAGVGLAAAWLGAALTLARLVAQSWAIHGADRAMSPTLLGPLVNSSWGHAWTLQLVGSLLAIAGFTLALHDTRRPIGWRLATIAALLGAIGASLTGHAAGTEGWARPIVVLADIVHLLAAGTWIGGVMMLAIAVLRRADAPAAANVVRRFSPWAIGGFLTLGLTGAISAWTHLEQPLAPWTTRYGRLLLLKLAIISIVLLLGALNWRRLGPTSSTGPGNAALRRSVWLEVLVALAVLAVTAVLVAVPPQE
jgi:copper transport protein